jgi:hypothetical protein
MQAVSNQLDFVLAHHQELAVRGAARALVAVKRGAVWLTQDNHTEDHVLAAGQTYRVPDDAIVRLHALKPAEVEMSGARHFSPLARLWRNAQAWYLRSLRDAASVQRRRAAARVQLRYL